MSIQCDGGKGLVYREMLKAARESLLRQQTSLACQGSPGPESARATFVYFSCVDVVRRHEGLDSGQVAGQQDLEATHDPKGI